MQVPCSSFLRTAITNFARKRLDSGSVDQPTMCHAQITESCAYHESETQAEYCHRGSPSTRRGDPHPHLSSHSQPNQLFPWTATRLRRSSGTRKAEQRKPPPLSPSRDRHRERLRSNTPLAMKEVLKTDPMQPQRDAQRYELLRDYLLRNGIIRHVALAIEDSEPFAMGATFYGPTFEQALDTLDL